MYFFMHTLSWGLSLLPIAVLDQMAHAMGWMVFSLFRIRRKLVLQNLRIAFPEKTEAERMRIGAASYYHFAATALEFLSTRDGTLGNTVTFHGEAYLRDVLAQNQGAYVICGHQGNWEAMAAAVGTHIRKSSVVVKPVGSAGTDRFVVELRNRNHLFCITRRKKGDGVRGMTEALRKNEVVGCIVDQSRPGSPFLPFFGKLAKTNTSLPYIWLRNKAPVLSAYTKRLAFGQHEVTFSPPMALLETGDIDADVLTHATHCNAVTEGMIRACPEQYFWMHNRWKGSPDL